jgi:ribosomal protein L22, bacterial type
MEVRAISKNNRISASKGRDLARAVQGKKVSEALKITEFSPRKAAAMLGRTIKSAAANASFNHGADVDRLYVVKAVFDEGASMRRHWPRARGSASPIEKQTSHITVVVGDLIKS